MKKHIYIIFCSLLSVLTFASCDDRDEIRDDINALSARLDALQVEFDKLNDNINTFYDLANGKTYFTSYTKDDRGNYTLTMSDGSTWTVYSGMPEGELPTLSVVDGKWVMNYKGITTEIGLANPTDGKDGSTPQMSIINGYWYCQIGDGEQVKVEGPYNVAVVEQINPSIFEKVTDNSDGSLTFKLYGNSDEITIKELGGLEMTFSDESSNDISEINISIASGSSKTITAILSDNVAQVVISPTPLGVKLEETTTNNSLTITLPSSAVAGETYTIYFEIFSDTGYRLLKSLKVTVTE